MEFDGLILSASGESYSDTTKIGYLKNTFSNPAKLYTAAVPKTTDYYVFSEEVERIMTNLETTDQFKAAYKRWLKEKTMDSGPVITVATQNHTVTTAYRVDADRDTIIAPTRTNGYYGKDRRDCKTIGSKQKAK